MQKIMQTALPADTQLHGLKWLQKATNFSCAALQEHLDNHHFWKMSEGWLPPSLLVHTLPIWFVIEGAGHIHKHIEEMTGTV